MITGIAVVVLLAAGGLVAWRWRAALADLAAERARAKDLEHHLAVAAREGARLRLVVEGLEHSIIQLEADLAKCTDPAAVRARVRGLLSQIDPPPSRQRHV